MPGEAPGPDACAEAKLDEALEDTFPASDPLANTVETGVSLGRLPSGGALVTDNATMKRFEIVVDGGVAFLEYERTGYALTLIHTEVPPAFRGRHLGETLVDAALQSARAAGLRIIAVCPFARAYMRKHPAAG
jgi:uncharacterized protein